MLDKKRTAIIFTANTPHLAHANLMIESLRDKDRGNFQGDLWVISTGLSERAKNFCDSNNIKFLISNLASLYNRWNNWDKIARAQPEYAENKNMEEGRRLKTAFEAYRNKRMSKLIILDWIRKFGEKYDFIALGDNDLLFQRDIHSLFEQEFEASRDTIHYCQEEYDISVGSYLWNKDFHFARLMDSSELRWPANEINIGFILGTPHAMETLFRAVEKSFFDIDISLFIEYRWHDQDLVRVELAKSPRLFKRMKEGTIVHLCAGGDKAVIEKEPHVFYYKPTGEKPYIIHFAGGLWKQYPSVRSTYEVNPDVYYFTKEICSEYDVVRKGSIVNLFDETSRQYYTEDNKESKRKSRAEWIERSGSGRNKVLFIGWLRTGTHKSTLENLPGVFFHDKIDLAVLNGNVDGQKYDNLICEDFPKIIAELSRTVKDQYLVRTYGFEIPNIPKWLFEDTVCSAMSEYKCSRKAALALANICYMYFSEALSFYNPQIVLLWGFLSPWGKLIGNLCKWKNIPIASLEWGILPGTAALDVCGHMGDSWVSQKSSFFNSLPVSEEDIENAEKYLSIAGNPELSRNMSCPVDPGLVGQINELRRQGKKIILYMESNSAHSGNTFSDEIRAKWHSPFFVDDVDAYEYINRLCEAHEDWHILYKPHPISITRGLKTGINEKNTTVVYTGGINEVIGLADLSITILSQSAYVSLIEGVPVLLLGRIQLHDSGAAYVVPSQKDIEHAVMEGLLKGITEEQRQRFVEHVARALKYYVFRAGNFAVSCRDSFCLMDIVNGLIEGDCPEQYKYDVAELHKYRKKAVDTSLPLVSVIMPVYNAAEYLAACIDSIIGQAYDNWELLCINNGSTDDSEKILQYYARRDARITVHHQDEPNQRIARNWGIDNAKGKYLYLMDSDDYLDLNALETLVKTAEEKKSELVYFFFKEVRTDYNPVRPRPRFYNFRKFFPDKKIFKLDEAFYKFFIQYPFPWAKLMRRDFVLENGLYFDLECSNFDDNPHNLRTLLSAKNPYVVNEQFYNFRIHTKSMTQSVNARIMGMIDAVRIMNEIYEEKQGYLKYQAYYVPYKVHLISWAWNLLPEGLRPDYYDQAKLLFRESDRLWFYNDEIWSLYEMPSSEQISFVEKMLESADYVDFCTVMGFYKKDGQELGTRLQPAGQAEPPLMEKPEWEKISKPHLLAIKICEKLHIIKFAIKVKRLFVRKRE